MSAVLEDAVGVDVDAWDLQVCESVIDHACGVVAEWVCIGDGVRTPWCSERRRVYVEEQVGQGFRCRYCHGPMDHWVVVPL